jgi:hypothetical protein
MTTDPGAHAGLLEGRASHVFTKPFRLEDVGHVLADLIDAHEIQPALAAVSVREHGITRKHGVGQARDVESPRWTRSTVFQRGMHMAKKLYVGNLPYAVTDSDLKGLFAQHGVVQSVQIIFDRDTGRSKGFGFVEFASEREAQAAIDAMNGKEVEGRKLTVNEARPREDRRGQHGASRHAAAGRY